MSKLYFTDKFSDMISKFKEQLVKKQDEIIKNEIEEQIYEEKSEPFQQQEQQDSSKPINM